MNDDERVTDRRVSLPRSFVPGSLLWSGEWGGYREGYRRNHINTGGRTETQIPRRNPRHNMCRAISTMTI